MNVWMRKSKHGHHRAVQDRAQLQSSLLPEMAAELTAVTSSMSSGKVCMKFMTLSLTGSLSTPPSCTGDTGEGRE